jgi:hypothetical protein
VAGTLSRGGGRLHVVLEPEDFVATGARLVEEDVDVHSPRRRYGVDDLPVRKVETRCRGEALEGSARVVLGHNAGYIDNIVRLGLLGFNFTARWRC